MFAICICSDNGKMSFLKSSFERLSYRYYFTRFLLPLLALILGPSFHLLLSNLQSLCPYCSAQWQNLKLESELNCGCFDLLKILLKTMECVLSMK